MNPNTDMIFVNGIEHARSYYQAPNTSRHYFDQNDQVFYVKSVDNVGNISQFDGYRFEKIDLAPQTAIAGGVTLEQISQLFDEKIEAALNKRNNNNNHNKNNRRNNNE